MMAEQYKNRWKEESVVFIEFLKQYFCLIFEIKIFLKIIYEVRIFTSLISSSRNRRQSQ